MAEFRRRSNTLPSTPHACECVCVCVCECVCECVCVSVCVCRCSYLFWLHVYTYMHVQVICTYKVCFCIAIHCILHDAIHVHVHVKLLPLMSISLDPYYNLLFYPFNSAVAKPGKRVPINDGVGGVAVDHMTLRARLQSCDTLSGDDLHRSCENIHTLSSPRHLFRRGALAGSDLVHLRPRAAAQQVS